MKKKEFVFTIIFIGILLIIFGFFPAENTFQHIFTKIVFFCIIPIIFNKLILKKELRDIGLQIGNWKQGLIWSGISFFGAAVLFFIAIYFFDLLKKYSIPPYIVYDYKIFVLYELTLVLFAVFVYDFFFRGFIMLTLGLKMNYWAIVLQAVIFLILVLILGSQKWVLVPYIILAPLAGIIVYKSKSIIYSGVLQFIILIILNASVVYLIKQYS